MKKYNPDKAPDPDAWQVLDESVRIDLVEEFHRKIGVMFEEGAAPLHASIHVVVENQIALEVEDVPETITRLIRQGLDRHEAIHAVGAIMSEDLFDLLKGNQKTWIRS